MKKFSILVLVTIILAVLCTGCGGQTDSKDEKQTEQKYQEYYEIGLYEKLKNHEKIEVLILGDSIGANSGSTEHMKRWDSLVSQQISEIYGTPVGITNLSVPGTGSLFGVVKMLEQETKIENYDMAFVCYGHNDGEASFDIYYETLIRTLKVGNPNIELIPIFESSQKEESGKKEKFQAICEYYELDYADMVEAFDKSGKSYDSLVKDGIHPNDDGYAIYSDEIITVLKDRVTDQAKGKIPETALNNEAAAMEKCKFVALDDMKKIDSGYEIEVECTALGMYYMLCPDGGDFTITVNGNTFERNNQQNGVTMESYELYYRNTDSKKVKVELIIDKDISTSINGIFYFEKTE